MVQWAWTVLEEDPGSVPSVLGVFMSQGYNSNVKCLRPLAETLRSISRFLGGGGQNFPLVGHSRFNVDEKENLAFQREGKRPEPDQEGKWQEKIHWLLTWEASGLGVAARLGWGADFTTSEKATPVPPARPRGERSSYIRAPHQWGWPACVTATLCDSHRSCDKHCLTRRTGQCSSAAGDASVCKGSDFNQHQNRKTHKVFKLD